MCDDHRLLRPHLETSLLERALRVASILLGLEQGVEDPFPATVDRCAAFDVDALGGDDLGRLGKRPWLVLEDDREVVLSRTH